MIVRRTCVGLLVAAAMLLPAAARADVAAAPPAPRRFAVVIGNNAPPRPDLPRLRYADDDAVRWAVLFQTLGATVEVLADLDPESQRLYGAAAPGTSPPSRAGLQQAVARIAAEIARARREGARSVLYFVYAGHGDEEEGKGYIALADGKFSRADLERMVLAVTSADSNHVILDACRASSFVYKRGPGGERRPWQHSYLHAPDPRFANTGFLLSSSADGLSHEWEQFQAGIFSHEVRSGMLGPADANGDGRITYLELTGFVRVANRPVRNERFRPHIVARAPPGGDDVLVDLRDARGGAVVIDRNPRAHQVLEDRVGIRWADLHPGAATVRLVLPNAKSDQPGFYLRSNPSGAEYVIAAGQENVLSTLEARPATLLRRGAIDDAFTRLFQEPFDAAAMATALLEPDVADTVTVEATPGADITARPPTVARPVGIGLTATGGAALALAAGLVIDAHRLRGNGEDASGAERARINESIETRNRWATVAGVGGGILAAAGIVIWTRYGSW